MIFTQRHKTLALYIIIVFIAGISSRVLHTGFLLVDKYLGDALYAVLFYLLLSFCWKKGTPLIKALLICGLMAAIETFQLTLIPLKLRFSPNVFLKAVSIVLGTTFAWMDMVFYIVGILGIYVLDRFYISKQVCPGMDENGISFYNT